MKTITTIITALFILLVFNVKSQPVWTQKADYLDTARYDFAGFSANSKGYIGGGRYSGPFNSLSQWQQYDPLTNTWSIAAAMPHPYTGLSAFNAGGYGYVVDGLNISSYDYDTYKYNHTGNNWSTLAAMTYPRLYAASAASGNFGYIIGGYGYSHEPLRDLWEYNSVTDTWTEKDTLPLTAARYYATAFSISGNIYIFGGTDGTNFFNNLWKYNPSGNTWTLMAPMPAAGRQQCMSFVMHNEAYIVGGTPNGPNLKEVWKYTPSTDSWSQLIDFPGANAPYGGVAFVISGKAYIACGNGTKECWEYDPGPDNVCELNTFKESLSVYPNPVVNTSVIELPESYKYPLMVDIYNSFGEMIKSISSNTNLININQSDFSKGIYFVKIKDKNSNLQATKFIVQ
jgi:N-acetylneuraminic acid mutarotase